MKFHDQGSPLTRDGFDRALAILSVDAATLWAVLYVETNGVGFLASRRPVILFERHVFHRLTHGSFDREHSDISNTSPGGYLGGPAEYSRLRQASALDESAALQSTSWGIGQIMGFNYEFIGYKAVQQMVGEMVHGEDEQLWAAAAFIEDCSMNEQLAMHDWSGFAKWYNGSGFGRNGYDAKLATTYQRFQQQLPDLEIRLAQVSLFYLGFDPGPIDGFLGPRTRSAVIAFQRKTKRAVTARLDSGMIDALCEAAFTG